MNTFEDDIINKSIMTNGNGAEVISFFFQHTNNPSCCEGMFDRTLYGSSSSKVNVICAKMFDTYYFLSDFEISSKEHLLQISSLTDYHIAHLIYSSNLRETPLLTAYFNDLEFTKHKVDIVNYSEFLAENNIYKAKNDLEKVVLCSPKTTDWYNQRTIVAHILQDFFSLDKRCTFLDEETFNIDKQRLYSISFRFDNQVYYWFDVLTGTDVHCSHLELISVDDVKVLFASESTDRTFIPNDPQISAFTPIYNRLKQNV